MSKKKLLFLIFILIYSVSGYAQTFSITGKIQDVNTGQGIGYTQCMLTGTPYFAYSDSAGNFILSKIPAGNYTLWISAFGYEDLSQNLRITNSIHQTFKLKPAVQNMDEVVLNFGPANTFGITRLKAVEGTAIYAGKKTEVIEMKQLTANTATNNTRQIYSKVPGLNIWESDGAGIQLGIGGRGLNPNRTSNFNTRQNGYDISADALGYPESYYTPPAEAIDRIEIVRGAGALQYGPQFGGLVNFKLRKGRPDTAIEVTSRQTAGSWGFFNTFNSVGGTKKKMNYYAFYQHKSGNGWRPNSNFNVNTAYASVTYTPTQKMSVTAEYTYMHYLAHQPGGLTDQMFAKNPRQSDRTRNWFEVNWNLFALMADYQIAPKIKFNTRFFSLIASRSALGLLIAPNRADPMGERNLWVDNYRNWGNETRLLFFYNTNKNVSALLVGCRYYSGFDYRRQGMGNSGSTGKKEDFTFVDPTEQQYAQYGFPSNEIAVFVENIFQITPKWSVTPGVRFENIKTRANGFYNNINTDLAGNIILNEKINVRQFNPRSFIIGGIGTSYDVNKNMEAYANISQNYRSITFGDMLIVNPNLRVDPNLQDERGYSTDAGIRGNISHLLNYDIGVFMINYNNRIGTVLKYDTVTFNTYRYTTNISQSRNFGFESFVELDIWKLIRKDKAKMRVSIFSNFSWIKARYIHSKETAYNNKKVEFVPNVILKDGLTVAKGKFKSTFQFSYTSSQYTDATNTEFTANAVNGLIPSYYIFDLSAQYTWKRFTLIGSINNLTNNMYFTRRAVSYPGPGIIPSNGRGFYLTLQVKI